MNLKGKFINETPSIFLPIILTELFSNITYQTVFREVSLHPPEHVVPTKVPFLIEVILLFLMSLKRDRLSFCCHAVDDLSSELTTDWEFSPFRWKKSRNELMTVALTAVQSHLSPMIDSAQETKKSNAVTNNIPLQEFSHPDDQSHI